MSPIELEIRLINITGSPFLAAQIIRCLLDAGAHFDPT
jgi:hypothetical protein